MDNIDVDIPEITIENDFTIFYKGKEEKDERIIEPIVEIKTSKNDFFRKLRYFKNKIYEFISINEIFIHDIFPVETFEEFINSLKTNKIRLNENNYLDLYKLSSKYQYYELQQKIDSFSKSRPDIQNIINNYSFEELDSLKEEKFAENLDICLQNERMINFPIPLLNRILNSPKRIIKNHHLLFQFIKKVINNRSSSNEDDFQILLGSLDYLQMSTEELDELFNNEHFTCIFNCRNSKEQMRTFIEERKFNQKRMQQLEDQMRKLSDFVSKKEKVSDDKIEKMEQKIVTQNEIISKCQSENKNLLEHIKKLEKKLNDVEQKAMQKPIKGSITANVESNQTIKGVINLIEINTKLDVKKSKYLINTNNSQELGMNQYESGSEINSCSQNISFVKPAGTYYIHALICDNYGNSNEIVSGPLITNGVKPLTFEFTGRVQSATLEPGNYKLEVWGAEGGKSVSNNCTTPGKGGYSAGVLSVKNKTKLYINVGQSPTTGDGGWNGGGSTHINYAGGGGSTDISLYGNDGSSDWNNTDHLYSRIIVAGGGGGSGNSSSNLQYSSGCGGGTNGQDCRDCNNSGGTQTRAGLNNENSSGQGFGIGGKQTGCCSGGGGSGWYGGSSSKSRCSTGGAGGSGYVYSQSTASNYPSGCKLNSSFYLTNASTIAGNCSFPNINGTGNETGHSGNGYAKITLI